MLYLHKIYYLKLKSLKPYFPFPGAIMTFSSLVIREISETRALSFEPVLCILNESSIEPYTVLFEIFFCEYYQQHLHVHKYLENLSFALLERTCKMKIYS